MHSLLSVRPAISLVCLCGKSCQANNKSGMTKKVGRNDPCPCGSGKKYKQCCMRNEVFSLRNSVVPHVYEDTDSRLYEYLQDHDSSQLLSYIMALQLNPANHGKNLRYERIAKAAVLALGKGKQRADIKVFKQIIDDELPEDLMEDIPTNMFCETVIFYGGNYLFFPGISTHSAELFRSMTEAIFYKPDHFPQEFRRIVSQGITLLLKLGTSIAHRARIYRQEKGTNNPREFISDPATSLDFAIPERMMDYLLSSECVDAGVLDCFVVDKDNPDLLRDIPDQNPLLFQPIVKVADSYYFISISNQGCAINNFIIKKAIEYQCLETLVNETQHGIWMRIGKSCEGYLHWMVSSIRDVLVQEEHYYDEVFQIDANWFAYVCYARDSFRDVTVDGEDGYAQLDIDSHLKSQLKALKQDKRTKSFHFLTFVVYSSMCEPFAVLMNDQPDSDYLLSFDAFDFLQLVQTEKWDSLSLLRYARVKSMKPSLQSPMNENLDVYGIYKHYGESFYLSDDQEPTFLQIVPNDGCRLIHESKEKLNYHGAAILEDGRLAYIPVQRDLDYADLYSPIAHSRKAKCCEAYSVPVWVTSKQVEEHGENPSSIVDTVMTAVAYWMSVLEPYIGQAIEEKYSNPIELLLQFSDDAISSKGLKSDRISGKGRFIVKKVSNGLLIFMDSDYLHGFMGSDNVAERDVMKKILEKLLDVEEARSREIIDAAIPLGSAKMILMTEVMRDLLSCPLWLYPPTYIHGATHQLLLDEVPGLMMGKNHDIDSKLEGRDNKVAFLRQYVDVILDRLVDKISFFNFTFLLTVLVNNHETLLYQRAHNKILQPAQILTFGDSEDKRDEYFETERRLTDAGLATRALIEMVSALQYQSGMTFPGHDDVESLMAMMQEVIDVGGICDAINLGISDHVIEKLPSGRYGIYEDGFSDGLKGFAEARSKESVNREMESFAGRMERFAQDWKPAGSSQIDTDTDNAFESDWGVSLTHILQFLYSCSLLGEEKQLSVIEMSESNLISWIKGKAEELSDNAIQACLKKFSLYKTGSYPEVTGSIDSKEFFPWRYNREYSFLRRPIIRLETPNTPNYLIGIRSCLMAGYQLMDLLFSGRLRFVGEKLNTVLGKYQAQKGRAFNKYVRDFLSSLPGLTVWQFDVGIKPKGNLIANEDLGDIDVLAYDNSRHILYSIECKNTNTAKNVWEMKKEMDDYLGRGDNPEKDQKKALVYKHLRRHKWLNEHIDVVKTFVGSEEPIEVKSMLLTSEVIPTSYLRKESLPLSILNISELKEKGRPYLDTCMAADISRLVTV